MYQYLKKTLILAATACACAFVGVSAEAKNKDFNYNEFLKTKYGVTDTTYIIGHKNPDSDTVCSAIAYAELKNKLGIPAEAIVCGPINDETDYALKYFGISAPKLVKDVKGLKVILVDHANYKQAADNMKSANIIEIVDHHQFGNIIPEKVIPMRFMPLGSVNTVIYSIYLENNVKPSKVSAGAMLTGILSDTRNLTENASALDKNAVAKLVKLAGLKDKEAFYTGMKEAAASYKGKTDKEIFYSDSKEYTMNGHKVMITCVNAKNEAAILEVAQRMQAIVPVAMSEKGLDYAFASITCDGVEKSAVVAGGNNSQAILEQAFGKTDKGIAVVNKLLVRKRDLVPSITKQLEK